MTRLDRTEEAGGAEIAQSSEQTAVVRAVSIEVSGPVPHPRLLAEYNDVISDGAERVVRLAEGQIHHRQSLEIRSQIFTFVLALIVLLGGIALIAVRDSATGLVPLVVAVAGLGGLFVYREMRSGRAS